MPLSEEEKRILDEIERNLEREDPRLAKEVGETTIYRHALGSLRWSVVLIVAGLAVILGTLRIHYLLALGGVALMVIGGLGVERNLSVMGRAGLQQMSSAIRSASQPPAKDETTD